MNVSMKVAIGVLAGVVAGVFIALLVMDKQKQWEGVDENLRVKMQKHDRKLEGVRAGDFLEKEDGIFLVLSSRGQYRTYCLQGKDGKHRDWTIPHDLKGNYERIKVFPRTDDSLDREPYKAAAKKFFDLE